MRFLVAILVTLASVMASAALVPNLHLTHKNSVAIRDVIDWSSVDKAQTELAAAVKERGAQNYPIYLVLDSPGGSIDAGETFIEFAKTVRNLHTVTIFAASMASAIVEALPGQRYVLESGVLMFHRARASCQGQVEDGELETCVDSVKKVVRRLEQRNADRIGITLGVYKQKVLNEWWLNTGAEAIAANGADKIISVSCSTELIETPESVNIDLGFIQIAAERSQCPLMRALKLRRGE